MPVLEGPPDLSHGTSPETARVLRRLTAGVTLAVVALAALGIRYLYEPQGLRRFDLDQEGTASAALTALMLGFTGLAFLALVRLRMAPSRAVLLVPVFVYMAFDEVFSFHENLETSTGVNSDFWLAPVVAVGAVGWVACVRAWRSTPVRALMVGGATAWFVSQVFELVGHSVLFYGDTREKAPRYGMWMVSEEVLEMAGSLLFLLAALYVLGSRSTPARAARAALGTLGRRSGGPGR